MSALQPPVVVPTVMRLALDRLVGLDDQPDAGLAREREVGPGGVGLGLPGRVGDPVDRQLDLVGVLAVAALGVEVRGAGELDLRAGRRRRRPPPPPPSRAGRRRR